MNYLFTRRSLNQGRNTFTDNLAEVTRYLGYKGKAEAKITGKAVMEPEDWSQSVLNQSQNGEVLVYVHGFNNTQSKVVSRLRKLRAKLSFQGAIIAFDWPTASSSNPLKLPKIYRSAKGNLNKLKGEFVTEGLNLIWREPKTTKIHVIGHSMGTYAIARAFSKTPDALGPTGKAWSVGEAIFGAADIDADSIKKGGAIALTMGHRSLRLSHFYSEEDKVLHMSQQMHGGDPRSGRAGINPDMPSTFHDISMTERYLKRTKSNEQTTQHSHNWYLDDAGFLDDLDEILLGTPAAKIKSRSDGPHGDQKLTP